MVPHTLHLDASSLFSKWGFGDGDCINDWYWDATDEPLPADIDDHRVLEQLVRDCLLPAIAAAGRTVELTFIETNHNPVRAQRVDGEDVADEVIYGDAEEPAWAKDIWVEITLNQLVLTPA